MAEINIEKTAQDVARKAAQELRDNGVFAGSWIPVSERLPEEGEEVLVWYGYFRYGEHNSMYYTYGIGYQYEGVWCGSVGGEKARCIAWMPLPAPFEQQESEG